MHRFFLKYKIENPQNIVIADKDVINKIKKVLRKKMGDTFFLFDIEGEEYQVVIEEINDKQIKCRFLSKNTVDRELAINITLYVALLKKDKLEWVVQKATEIGVKKITLMVTENCVIKELSKNKIERYKKIITEATMQCGGKLPPELTGVVMFEQAVQNLDLKALNIIAHETEQDNKLIAVIKDNKTINLFIGPEGGFSQAEIDLAKRHSVIPVSLGKRILRAETAAIVACGIIGLSS